MKYNTNLLKERPLQSYDAFLQLSPDKQVLKIVKKVVIQDYEVQGEKERENEANLHFKFNPDTDNQSKKESQMQEDLLQKKQNYLLHEF